MKNILLLILAMVVAVETYFLFKPVDTAIEKYKIDRSYSQNLVDNYQQRLQSAYGQNASDSITRSMYFPKVVLDALCRDIKKLPGKNTEKGFRIYLGEYGTFDRNGNLHPDRAKRITAILSASVKPDTIGSIFKLYNGPIETLQHYNYPEICPSVCSDGGM